VQDVRRQVHFAPAALSQAVDELSGLQEAGAQDHFHLQFAAETQAAVRFGRKKGRVYRAQKSQQRRVRTAVNPF